MLKRRILCAVLSLCLLVTLLPTAFAAEPQDAATGMKDAYKNYFKIGTALSAAETRKAQAQELVLREFNSVTCENEMKPQNTLDQARCQANGNNTEVYLTLSNDARTILSFCEENHIPMRGHVFCWHSQTPAWLFNENFQNNGATVSKEIMNQRLESYIKNYFELLATEYPDLEFYSFDVVNEAFTDSNPANMRDSNSSGWIRVYGDNTFIYKAFEYAQKYKPEGCLLAYNDYNEYDEGKLNAIYAMCKDLYAKGLLDAVGMQSHLSVNNPTIEKYSNALAKYASIGCKIMVTELDVGMRGSTEQAQAEYLGKLFELYGDYKDQIEAIVFWGTQDGMSWRGGENALVFNSSYEPKACYDAIMDAVSDHEHVYESTVVPPTCTEDGCTREVCKICGRTVITNVVSALGHDWDEGVVTLEPTDTTPGVRTFTCQREGCGATKTKRIPKLISTVPDDIDFTLADDADKYEILGQSQSEVQPGVGLPLISTQGGIEPAKQNIAEANNDVVRVEVSDDWTATLEVQFDTNGASNGYYQFFGFYAAQGEDNQNLVGIRGGDGAMQDFIRKGGSITEETKSSSPGFNTSGKTYWLRIEKVDTTYTCFRSDDGEEFTQMFAYEDTGIDPEYILIDAYTGMTTGYKFTLKSLTFEEPDAPQLNKKALKDAISAAEKLAEADYTAGTWTPFAEALAAAKTALANATTQEAIDAAKDALTDAQGKLEKKPDEPALNTEALGAAITAAEALVRDEYTEESWAALEGALAAAKHVLDEGKTQDEIDDAKASVDAAVAALVKKDAGAPDKFEFDDVKDTSKFYYAPVYWAVNHEPQITNGATATTFNPDGACTRGHVVTFLWRAAGEPAPSSTASPFTDLKESAFYYNAVLWAVENGITTGASKTSFAPGKPCTRGQIVTFLWRFKGSPEPTSTENPFADVKADGFYYKAVLWAVENGVTSGTGKGKFSPDSTCTRGQVVTFLYRAAGDAVKIGFLGEVTLVGEDMNAATFKGIQEFAKKNGCEAVSYTPEDLEDIDSIKAAVDKAVEGGCKLVVMTGFMFMDACMESAEAHPDVSFLLLDVTKYDYEGDIPKNVALVTYAEEQAGFLAGYAAVQDGYTRLGFLGGFSFPTMVRYGYGFVQGADAAAQELNKDVQLNYWYANSFAPNDEITVKMKSWYAGGTEIVFACGGSIVSSCIEAAEDKGGKVIGVDVDQSALSDCVVTSAMKDLYGSVQIMLGEWFEAKGWTAKFAGDETRLGMDSDAVKLPIDTSRFTSFDEEAYAALKQALAGGTLTVSDEGDDEVHPVTVKVTVSWQ